MIHIFFGNLESIFDWLFRASWQASVLVALVLIIQRVFRSRLNSRWTHALWLLVIARLLLPALPESAFSLFQYAPLPPQVIVQSVTAPIFTPSVSADTTHLSAPPGAPTYPFSIRSLLALLWLTGALVLLLLTWQVNRRFSRHVRDTLPVDDPVLLQIAAAAQTELGLHHSLRLIESARVQGPAIMGLVYPTLILPQNVRAKFSDSELRLIFLHELAHLKRGDLILQWFVAILQILHWFNPALWYAFRRMRADRESATDALVLSRTGEVERYGQVLIKLLDHYHQRHSLPTLVGILEDKDYFKRRFTLIGQFTRGAYGWSLPGVGLLMVLSAIGLTAAEKKTIDSHKEGLKTQSIPDTLVKKSITSATSLNGLFSADIEADSSGPGMSQKWVVRNTKTNQVLASGPMPRNPQREVEPIGSDQVRIEWNYTPFSDCFFVLTIKRPDREDGLLVALNPTDNKGHFSNTVTNLDWGSATRMTSCEFIGDAELKVIRETDGRAAPFYLTVLNGVVQGSPIPPDMARIKLRHMLKVIQAGDAPQLQQMIDQGVDCRKLEASFQARPNLLLETVNPEVAEILIRNGIDPNARNSDGIATLGLLALQPSYRDMTEVARVILDHGADFNFRMGKSGVTAMMLAQTGKLVDLLVARGADPKLKTSAGQSAFHFSASHDVSALEALARHGALFDPKRDGPDLLLLASALDNTPVVQWLLNHGVDPHEYQHSASNISIPSY